MIMIRVEALLFLSCCSVMGVGGSLRDTIITNPDLSIFRDTLQSVGLLDGLLGDESQDWTVFAPTNAAMESSPEMSLYQNGLDETPLPRWYRHLNETLLHHIVPSQRLTKADIFDTTRSELQSLNGALRVVSEQVETALLVVADQEASNGILHMVDSVFPFFENSFARLELQPEYGPDHLDRVALVDIVDFVEGRPVLNQVHETGATFAGCRIRGLNRMGLDYLQQTINGAPNVKFGELLNETRKVETTRDFIEYSIVEKNYILEDIPEGFVELVTPVARCGHMWVTKKNGKLCFNDGCVVETPAPRTYLSSNGVGYVIDKCQICPGITMLTDYASRFITGYSMVDAAQLFLASEWNRRALFLSVGDGTSVTLFASVNSGMPEFLARGELVRLTSPKWQRHLWDLLKHWIVQGEYTKRDLQDEASRHEGGTFNLTMLSGSSVAVGYDANRDMVKIGEGDLFYPDIAGVDGLVHFVSSAPVPPSVRQNAFTIVAEEPKFQLHVTYIRSVFLNEDLIRLSPLTALYAPNEAFENKMIALDKLGETLNNHIFKELLWCEELLDMKGQQFESTNGQTWLVSENDDGFPCFEHTGVDDESLQKSCITKCDILVNNGIVHEIDSALILKSATPTAAPTNSPTSAAVNATEPPEYSQNATAPPTSTDPPDAQNATDPPTDSPEMPNATEVPTDSFPQNATEPPQNATISPDDAHATLAPNETVVSTPSPTAVATASFNASAVPTRAPSPFPTPLPTPPPTLDSNIFSRPKPPLETPPPTSSTEFQLSVAVYVQGLTQLMDQEQIDSFIRALQKYLDDNEQDETVIVVFVSQKLFRAGRPQRGRSLQTITGVEVETVIKSRINETPGLKSVQLINSDSEVFVDTLKAEDPETFGQVQNIRADGNLMPPSSGEPEEEEEDDDDLGAIFWCAWITLLVSVLVATYLTIQLCGMLKKHRRNGKYDECSQEEIDATNEDVTIENTQF